MKVLFQKHEAGLSATIIRWLTNSPYSHCELLFHDNLMFSSRRDKKGTSLQRYHRFNYFYWDILEVPMLPEEESRVRTFCVFETGCPNDDGGLWRTQFKKLRRKHPDKWFCSEVCAAAMQRAGYFQGREPHCMTPGDIFKRLRETGAALCPT